MSTDDRADNPAARSRESPHVPGGAPAAFHREPLAAVFSGVYAAWLAAWARGTPTLPALDAAVDRLADVAHAQRQLAMDLFQAIDLVPPRERAGDACRAWDAVRRHVGMRLIRRYCGGR